jgi:hypothetical protein
MVFCNNCKHYTYTYTCGVYRNWCGCPTNLKKLNNYKDITIVTIEEPRSKNRNNDCNDYCPTFFEKISKLFSRFFTLKITVRDK